MHWLHACMDRHTQTTQDCVYSMLPVPLSTCVATEGEVGAREMNAVWVQLCVKQANQQQAMLSTGVHPVYSL